MATPAQLSSSSGGTAIQVSEIAVLDMEETLIPLTYGST